MISAELQEKIDRSIKRAQMFCHDPAGYFLAFSGGKDSIVCKQLLIEAGVPFSAFYRVTSVDPPELVQFIKQNHPDVKREIPTDEDGRPITMWNLIPKKKTPPTRIVRYCCAALKESAGDGRLTVTGVRWEESTNRKLNQGVATVVPSGKKTRSELLDSGNFAETRKRGVVLVNDNDEARLMLENCVTRHKVSVNIIIDWTDADVWNFIRDRGLPYCSLYDEGFRRIGCIGCPMARREERIRELTRWPKFRDAYLRAFQRMIDARKAAGMAPLRLFGLEEGRTATPRDVMRWWITPEISLRQETLTGTGAIDAGLDEADEMFY